LLVFCKPIPRPHLWVKKRMNLHWVCHSLSWEILLAAVQNCSGNDACWFCGSNGGNWGLGGMWQGSKRASFFIRQCIFFSQRMLTNKRFSGGTGIAIDPMDYAGGLLNLANLLETAHRKFTQKPATNYVCNRSWILKKECLENTEEL